MPQAMATQLEAIHYPPLIIHFLHSIRSAFMGSIDAARRAGR
jgi:hypothetical protein